MVLICSVESDEKFTSNHLPETSTPIPMTILSISNSNKFTMTISCFVFIIIIIFGAPIGQAAVIQAVIEIDGSPENVVKIILDRIDHLIDYKRNLTSNKVYSNGDTETDMHVAASSTLMNFGATPFTSTSTSISMGKRFLIRGNITDNSKTSPNSSIHFQFYAEVTNRTTASTNGSDVRWPMSSCRNDFDCDDADDDHQLLCEDEDSFDNWCYHNSNGGILNPVVKAVEPYVMGLLNIIFHGIMTSIISKIMDNANMTGELRIA